MSDRGIFIRCKSCGHGDRYMSDEQPHQCPKCGECWQCDGECECLTEYAEVGE